MGEYGRVSTRGGYIVRVIENICLGESHGLEGEGLMRLAKISAISYNQWFWIGLRCRTVAKAGEKDRDKMSVQLDAVVDPRKLFGHRDQSYMRELKMSGDQRSLCLQSFDMALRFLVRGISRVSRNKHIESFGPPKRAGMFHVAKLSALERRQASMCLQSHKQ